MVDPTDDQKEHAKVGPTVDLMAYTTASEMVYQTAGQSSVELTASK